jgi:response regulator RpfG family c-di-GMP phosphodiesterase
MAKGKNVLTTGDVARICNVAPRTVSKWFDTGQLRGYRIPGSKDRRIPIGELVRFMKANDMPTDTLPAGKIRVLVIDGRNGQTAPMLNALASRGPYDVQAARTGFEAGAAMQRFSPHVILMNLLTPEVEAHDLCRSIRASAEHGDVKILALANCLTPPEAAALTQRGFDGYVSDPSDFTEIIRRIEEVTAVDR